MGLYGTRAALLRRLGPLGNTQLEKLCANADSMYAIHQRKKPRGGWRTISEPYRLLKLVQTKILQRILQEDIDYIPTKIDYASGKRDHVDAVQRHGGRGRWIGSVDISDFYGTVSHKRVYELFRDWRVAPDSAGICTRLTTRHGSLPQGAPTSPFLPSAVLGPFDVRIQELPLVVTRYVDDIVVSSERRGEVQYAVESIIDDLHREGFKIKRSKIEIAKSDSSLPIHGISPSEVVAPKSYRKRLRSAQRAAEHRPYDPRVSASHEGKAQYVRSVKQRGSKS